MARCLLDDLPVELIHHIWEYFFAHDIFYTFTNVSSYIDNVLHIYPNYRLNFKSIPKKAFDLVCQRIIPNQIISLTLCDDDDTPGQVGLFLSRFQISQFVRLHSLTLIDVGSEFWESIVTKLTELKNLRSFFFHVPNRSKSWICKISSSDLEQLDIRLFEIYNPIFLQLTRLKLNHGRYFKSIQFPHLRHLILAQCTLDIMKYIASVAPQLKSLEAEIIHYDLNAEIILQFRQLKRLVLKILNSDVSMNSMERLLSNFPSLKYFGLQAHGSLDVSDGQQWQKATQQLHTFNFRFHLSADLDSQQFDSFRSSYWLHEKHWYVAYANDVLFSVPFFADTYTADRFQSPVLCTLPDSTTFDQCITQLTLWKPLSDSNRRFTQVETLSLDSAIPLPAIEAIIDLNRIQHLSLSLARKYPEILSVMNNMPNLCRFSITDEITSFLEEVQFNSFNKIRYLHIDDQNGEHDDNENKYDIKSLYSVFPHVDHLKISHRCSMRQILNVLNQFKHLSTASFHCFYLSGLPNGNFINEKITKIQLPLDKYRQQRNKDFTYRFDSSSVYLWL